MGQARVYGTNVNLFLLFQPLFTPIPLGEIDKFSATSLTTISKSRPVGFVNEMATMNYGGWDLSFEGGKVDWDLAQFYLMQDDRLRAGHLLPQFAISERIEHYGGGSEHYLYNDVTLFGFGTNMETRNEVSETLKGFSPFRTRAPLDNTALKDPVKRIMLEAMFRAGANVPDVGSIVLDNAVGIITGKLKF